MYYPEITEEINRTHDRLKAEKKAEEARIKKNVEQKVPDYLDRNKTRMIESIKNNKTFDEKIIVSYNHCSILEDFVDKSGVDFLRYHESYNEYTGTLRGCSINATFWGR